MCLYLELPLDSSVQSQGLGDFSESTTLSNCDIFFPIRSSPKNLSCDLNPKLCVPFYELFLEGGRKGGKNKSPREH